MDRQTSTAATINAVRMQFHETIKLQQAQRLKTLLVHDSLSDYQHQFQLLPAYLDHL